MPVPGPAALGRGVVVNARDTVPTAWSAAPVVVVDEAAALDPSTVVPVLHQAWASRTPVAIVLAVDPATFRQPVTWKAEPWQLDPAFEPWHDRLHFLVWANTYDARDGVDPIWWWGRKALRLGAAAGGAADVVLGDGSSAWIDGGPRGPLDLRPDAIVHRDSVDLGRLVVAPAPAPPTADLAPDQLAAVDHGSGPARIIAPAGSGKTRVLTERLRHLIRDWGWEASSILAVAFNVRARDEMVARTGDLQGVRCTTLNQLGYRIVREGLGTMPRILDERDVRRVVDGLVDVRRRANQDAVAPYLEALGRIRLGLRDPADVEAELDDVEGLADQLWPRFRAALRAAGGIDFDEQIYLAIELLLRDGELRARMQQQHRHLLIDEFQDLTPAHVLLLRLLCAPAYDAFGVGDDDQCLYSFNGASPRFLTEFDRYFPGGQHHALEVNYRCPVVVVDAARHLLSGNVVRVAKEIRSGPAADTTPTALVVRRHQPEDAATDLASVVVGWLAEGTAAKDVAVLTRVNSLLLAPHVALHERGVPLRSDLGAEVLDRTGAASALAYLRIGSAETFDGADVVAVYRRPSRGLPQWFPDRLRRRFTLSSLRDLGTRMQDKDGAKLDRLCDDLALVQRACRGTTREALRCVRDDIGLGEAMTLLDASKGGQAGANMDDLEALLQLADLHPDAATFEGWLRGTLQREADQGGVTLATVHRTKGQEWDRVAVFGATDGVLPHRLSDDVEEERRILHVGITRGRQRVVVLGDRLRPSPFLDELEGKPAARRRMAPVPAAPSPARAAVSSPKGDRPPVVEVATGLAVRTRGGLDGVVGSWGHDGVKLEVDGGASVAVRWAEPVWVAESRVVLGHPGHAGAVEALKVWRRTVADGKPAYTVFSDANLEAITLAWPTSLADLRAVVGVGPAKLERYGDDVLTVLAGAAP